MSEYRYTTNIGLPGITANVLLNKEFGLNLKPEYDSYKCDEYEIILDGDMAFIHFKELCIPFIRHTMDRMSNALGYDKYYWDVRDELEDKDIEEEEEEEIVVEEEEEVFTANENQLSEEEILVEEEQEYNSDDDREEMPYEEVMRIHNIIKEQIEEAKREAEEKKKKEEEEINKRNEAADILYQNKFDYYMAREWHFEHAQFMANVEKHVYLIEYPNITCKKMLKMTTLYNYIKNKVNVLALYEVKSINSIIKFLLTVINKIHQLKKEAYTSSSITVKDYRNFNEALDESLVEVEKTFTLLSKKNIDELNEDMTEKALNMLKIIEENEQRKKGVLVQKKKVIKKAVKKEEPVWNGWQQNDTEETFIKRREEYLKNLTGGKQMTFEEAAKKMVETGAAPLFQEVKVKEEEPVKKEENYNILINIGHNLPDKSFLAYKFNTSIPALANVNIVIYDKIKGFSYNVSFEMDCSFNTCEPVKINNVKTTIIDDELEITKIPCCIILEKLNQHIDHDRYQSILHRFSKPIIEHFKNLY